MRSKNQIAIEEVLVVSVANLNKLQTQIREDLLEVIRALSMVTGKPQVEYLQDLNKAIAFRIRLIKGIRKKRAGRPKLKKGNEHNGK